MSTQAISVSPSRDLSDVEPSSKAERRASSSAGGAHPLAGMLWFGGWLFTIGFAKLVWWKVLLALVAWPYFLGVTVR